MVSISRKQNDYFLKKIDSEWQGLFKVLVGKGSNLILAEEWIQTTMGCGYRELKNWTTLIKDLSHLEPTIYDNAIILKPIFVMLTCDIQRNLLSILYNHRHSINHNDLAEFVSLIRNYVYQDAWTEKLYESLVDSMKETDEGLGNKRYSFSEDNKQLYQNVLNNLSQASHSLTIPWQRSLNLTEFKDKSSANKNQPEDSPELFAEVETGTNHQAIDAIDINASISSEQLGQNQSNTAVTKEDNCESIVISSDDEDFIQTDSKKRKRKRTESLNESCVQILKKSKEFGNDEDSGENKGVKTSRLSLDIQLLKQILKQEILSVPGLDKNQLQELKDNWSQGQNTSSFRLFIDSPVDLIKDYLYYLELWNIEDDSLSTICEYFIQESNSLSYDTIVSFLQYSLRLKFLEIKQAPSRTLSNLITRISEVFPKQTIDILIGITLEKELNSIQTDIICKLIKQVFNTLHLQYLLGYLVSESKALTENIVSIVQALIDQKVEINQDVSSHLIGCLSASALSLANSQKFGKLLLHFINKYGQQWKASDLSRVQVVLDRHTSFLKKTALLSFKKLLK